MVEHQYEAILASLRPPTARPGRGGLRGVRQWLAGAGALSSRALVERLEAHPAVEALAHRRGLQQGDLGPQVEACLAARRRRKGASGADNRAVSAVELEQLLEDAYRAFNSRDAETATRLMHPRVEWPNAWEGGRVVGREAVAAYWARQFEAISSTVEPEAFDHRADGSIDVTVHQVVRDAEAGTVVADERVIHRYRFEHGLVARMDVVEEG